MPASPGTASSCALIGKFEGCRLTAYQDQGGVWTCGYGATGKGIGPGTTWTQEQADEALSKRVWQCRHILEAMVGVPLTDDQWDACTSLAYNIGEGNFEHSTLLRVLNEGNYAAAAEQFLVWNKVHGAVNVGLANRRQAERALFLRGTPLASG